MDNFTGLLGNNIQYSKSPKIHNEYYRTNNIHLEYKLFDISRSQVSNFINNLRINNIIGFNVTIPYKEEILKYLDYLEYPADKIEAVNTVVVIKNKLIGFNTDYYGFVQSLKENNINLVGKNALIIGNGGSALCIYYALMDIGCKCVEVVCRNPKNNEKLLNKCMMIFNFQDEIDYRKYDLIVNCTPLGGENYKNVTPINLMSGKFKKDLVVYDLNYSPNETLLLTQAKTLAMKTINGEQMLKFQAQKAIKIWETYIC